MLKFLRGILARLRDDPLETDLTPYRSLLAGIRAVDLSGRTDAELKASASGLKDRPDHEPPENLLIETFSLVNEAVRRTLGLRAFDCQIIAGIVMARGKLAEMATGEGKTLAAVFPACLNALSSRGVHILTFNDYLSRRDAEWMGPVYRFLGLSVAFIRQDMTIPERQKAYNADVTYVTAREAGFDHLRDCLCRNLSGLVHRPLNFCLVDEADSILIDEGRIPLVIAGERTDSKKQPLAMSEIVRQLRPGTDYGSDRKARTVHLTEEGSRKAELLLGRGNLFDIRNIEALTDLNTSLQAEALYHRDRDYIVRDGAIEIVDEFTGRVAENRHWPDGLHMAIEAKEGLKRRSRGRILGSVTLQHFLGSYPRLCGMTATASPSSGEIREFYGLKVAVIPPNKPCVRIDHPDAVFATKQAKSKAVVDEIKRCQASGRPVLLGTSSVAESETIAGLLAEAGVGCRILNARNDEQEAKIVAEAGSLGAVTVSTNMAGRGVDIRLGGSGARTRDIVLELGGLYVIGTNRHESRRIDDQLIGRSARQADPGASRFYLSLEDDLLTRSGIVIPRPLLPANADEPADDPLIAKEIARCQRIVEGRNLDLRKSLWKYSEILELQRRLIQQRRKAVLSDAASSGLLRKAAAGKYRELSGDIGQPALNEIEKNITLFHIDECWADHLAFAAYIREGIHLTGIGGQNPLEEFNRTVTEAFLETQKRIDEEIVKSFLSLDAKGGGLEEFDRPSATWTYTMNDNSLDENLGLLLAGSGNIGLAAGAAFFAGPLLLATLVYRRFFGKKAKSKNPGVNPGEKS